MSEGKTKTEEFAELLEQYESEKEAKKHIKEIAKKLNVSKSLGYKALKQIKWKEAPALPPAEEPTIKIPEIPIEEEIPEALEEEEIEEEEVEEEVIPPEIEEEIPKPPEEVKAIPDEVEKLKPIFLRSINRGVKIITTRIGEIPEASLTDEETEDTLTIINLFLLKYTPVVLEKYYLEVTALTHFGTLIADKIMIWRKSQKAKKEEEKEIEEKIREREAEKSKSERPKEEPKIEEPKLPKTLPHLPYERKASILGEKA